MSSNRRAPGFYGAKVEDWVIQKYGLERDYSEVGGARMDAVEPETGRPVEIKAVGLNRSGGRPGESRWKIWRDQHRELAKAGGYYVFVSYRLRPNGIDVVNSRAVKVSDISVEWYGETEPRGAEQAELRASDLF